jgi:hypothetical protein
MPPKSAKGSSKKRALQESDPNAVLEGPAAKKSSAKKKSAATAATAADDGKQPSVGGAAPAQAQGTANFRVARGPNGEEFLPRFLPAVCAKHAEKLAIPPSWIGGLDGSPNQEMTLGDLVWWEKHTKFLAEHKTKLGLKPQHWKMRESAKPMIKDTDGKHDWDFVCLHRPSWDIKAQKKAERGASEGASEDGEFDDSEDESGSDDGQPGNQKDGGKDLMGSKIAYQLASLHPDHAWVFSLLGGDRSQWWIQESLKRDQDEFEMHVYNDFSNYGNIEVLENIVSVPLFCII